MSYPDLVEEQGKYYLTETQKDIARVHEIDPALLEGLWKQAENRTVATAGILLDLAKPPQSVDAVALPELLERSRRGDYGTADRRAGFTLDLTLTQAAPVGQALLDSRAPDGRGLALVVTANHALELILSDGRTESRWRSDAGAAKARAVTVIVDGGPKIITYITDGTLHDGGEERQYGWGRYNPNLKNVNGAAQWKVAPMVGHFRVYGRGVAHVRGDREPSR